MSRSTLPRPIVILGPTAGGKSELAVALAERLLRGGEILGADSMQVYRHLEAGTAKPEPALRRRGASFDRHRRTDRALHRCRLARAAEALMADLQQRGKHPIIVGGTNLYLKVLLEGMFDAPAHDPAFRATLEPVPTPELHARLQQIDPAAAARIHPNDRKRTIRALEVHHQTGKPISEQQRQWGEAGGQGAEGPRGQGTEGEGAGAGASGIYRHDPILIGLTWPAEAINRRINQRVKHMFHPQAVLPEAEIPALNATPLPPNAGSEERSDEGPDQPPDQPEHSIATPLPESLPDEVRRLEAQNVLGPQAREALGYKQVLAYLHGRCSLNEAFEQTKIQTRRFAKQQRTWLRRFRGVHWLPAAELTPEALAEQALAAVGEA